jgi:hypothetical protein
MKRLAILILMCLTATAASSADTIPDTDIEAAIRQGLASKRAEVVVTHAWQFTLVLEGPLIRIQREAADAAKSDKPFTRADVTDAMLAPTVLITAVPDRPTYGKHGWAVTPPATTIVLQPKGTRASAISIHPTGSELFPMEWGNATGATFHGQAVAASFNLRDLPVGDFEIIVVTEGEERRATVKGKNRAQIR